MGVNITTLNKNDVKYVFMNKQPTYSYLQVTASFVFGRSKESTPLSDYRS